MILGWWVQKVGGGVCVPEGVEVVDCAGVGCGDGECDAKGCFLGGVGGGAGRGGGGWGGGAVGMGELHCGGNCSMGESGVGGTEVGLVSAVNGLGVAEMVLLGFCGGRFLVKVANPELPLLCRRSPTIYVSRALVEGGIVRFGFFSSHGYRKCALDLQVSVQCQHFEILYPHVPEKLGVVKLRSVLNPN